MDSLETSPNSPYSDSSTGNESISHHYPIILCRCLYCRVETRTLHNICISCKQIWLPWKIPKKFLLRRDVKFCPKYPVFKNVVSIHDKTLNIPELRIWDFFCSLTLSAAQCSLFFINLSVPMFKRKKILMSIKDWHFAIYDLYPAGLQYCLQGSESSHVTGTKGHPPPNQGLHSVKHSW